MESNGQPGRIHVSPSTAENLTQQGKGRWLIPREDPIVAKGKGVMQTYWINHGVSSVTTSTAKETLAEQTVSTAADLEDNDHPEVYASSEMIDARGTTLVSL